MLHVLYSRRDNVITCGQSSTHASRDISICIHRSSTQRCEIKYTPGGGKEDKKTFWHNRRASSFRPFSAVHRRTRPFSRYDTDWTIHQRFAPFLCNPHHPTEFPLGAARYSHAGHYWTRACVTAKIAERFHFALDFTFAPSFIAGEKWGNGNFAYIYIYNNIIYK